MLLGVVCDMVKPSPGAVEAVSGVVHGCVCRIQQISLDFQLVTDL